MNYQIPDWTPRPDRKMRPNGLHERTPAVPTRSRGHSGIGRYSSYLGDTFCWWPESSCDQYIVHIYTERHVLFISMIHSPQWHALLFLDCFFRQRQQQQVGQMKLRRIRHLQIGDRFVGFVREISADESRIAGRCLLRRSQRLQCGNRYIFAIVFILFSFSLVYLPYSEILLQIQISGPADRPNS